MTDAQKIADGLTEAQRVDIIGGNCCYSGETCVCRSPDVQHFIDIGLAHKGDLSGRPLTPFGREVRSLLTAKDGA